MSDSHKYTNLLSISDYLHEVRFDRLAPPLLTAASTDHADEEPEEQEEGDAPQHSSDDPQLLVGGLGRLGVRCNTHRG